MWLGEWRTFGNGSELCNVFKGLEKNALVEGDKGCVLPPEHGAPDFFVMFMLLVF